MEIYLPVMPVEMTYEVGDRNFLLNALPHMMLLMIRDGHSQKEVEKVTGLSSQALAQERQALLQQGLIKENGELSDTAKLALDIYEFEDNHKEEKHLTQNIDNALNEITSNVGKVIQDIIDDKT